eukprot:TRINITY_DN7069_c0_g1_i1.p1 TRINITY_DN7069_c0_g1~~TRINITY_DN7069_c0_g1_i1.p1  ORF type:complete len:303 (+),score=15.49 TRINITY_DN7069_c0_g1_i1:152-1060(+)
MIFRESYEDIDSISLRGKPSNFVVNLVDNERYKILFKKSIDMGEVGLANLPSGLQSLPSLRSLNVSGNKITSIQPWFENLTHLSSLDLSKNKLGSSSSLNDVFPVCLKSLNLSFNYYSIIPPNIRNCDLIEVLDISHNRILNTSGSVVPSNLIRLDLSVNQIYDFPPQFFDNLKNLKELNLSFNKINVLPSDMGIKLPNLVTLDLSGNSITTVPSSIAKCKQLTSINLSHNLVYILPLQFQALSGSLKELSISHNPLYSPLKNNVDGDDAFSLPVPTLVHLTAKKLLNKKIWEIESKLPPAL